MALTSYCTAGGKKESISRSAVNDFLKKIDPSEIYCKFTPAILREVQTQIESGCTGYVLVSTADIIGVVNGKKDEYMMCNGLLSEKLQQVVSLIALRKEGGNDQSCSFSLFVFFAILCAPMQRITLESLCAEMHKIDKRFPVSVNLNEKHSTSYGDALPIPELGNDFHGLVKRMKKVPLLKPSLRGPFRTRVLCVV